MIKESCSCGATFEMDDKRWSQPEWANKGITVEQQEVLRWRESHRHDIPKLEDRIVVRTDPFVYTERSRVPPMPDPVAEPGTVR